MRSKSVVPSQRGHRVSVAANRTAQSAQRSVRSVLTCADYTLRFLALPEPVRILHLDEDVVVVDKPPGLVVHRGWAREPVVVMTLVRDALGKHVYPVHRLDRGTSGALVLALSPEAAGVLGEAFASGAVDKRYLAIVRGVAPEEVVIDHPVPRSEDGPRVDAITEVRRLFAVERYSLVEARPRTGRLHQIRRHLRHIGHPIVWDKKYGRGYSNDFARELYGIDRLALHARSVAFRHPRTGDEIRVVAPIVDLAPSLERMNAPRALWG